MMPRSIYDDIQINYSMKPDGDEWGACDGCRNNKALIYFAIENCYRDFQLCKRCARYLSMSAGDAVRDAERIFGEDEE